MADFPWGGYWRGQVFPPLYKPQIDQNKRQRQSMKNSRQKFSEFWAIHEKTTTLIGLGIGPGEWWLEWLVYVDLSIYDFGDQCY